MNRGYVKIWRKIDDSGLLGNAEVCQLFMFLMVKAAYKPRKIMAGTQIIELQPGQYFSGRKQLAAELNSSEQKVRTALKILEKHEIINQEATSKGSVISLVNWRKYQDEQPAPNQQINQEPTIIQPSPNQQRTTNQEVKNKNKNKINKTQSKHENEDPAREPEPAQVGLGESEIALPDPSLEFQELRGWYSAHARPEGGMAGFSEFKQAKAARTWPGQNRIYDDLTERCASDKWRRGFAPSLANYLKTQGWTAPPEREADAARASPDMPRATTQKQKQEQEREAMALMVLERRRNKNAQSRNDAGGHIDAAFALLPAGGV